MTRSNYTFKSYYVVWKQGITGERNTRKRKFKSYYVVWKQTYEIKRMEGIILFKSYYVVWKPFEGFWRRWEQISLNRTM